MIDRVRPQRLGKNQNYIQRNKPRAFWMSAPLTHQSQKQVDENGGEILTYNGLPLVHEGKVLFDTPDTPDSGLTPFTVSKVVVLGASIVDQSISTQSTRSFIEAYLSSKYGLSVSVVERATAGQGVAGIRASIDSIVADYAAEPDTHFAIHAGGNDVLVGTEFLDNTEAKKTQLIDDLNYIYDAVQGSGKKLVQSSLTFRNYDAGIGGIIDNDPSNKVNELLGSYTYTRDWIVPVMQNKAPEFLSNGWPMIDQYNITRNIYEDWKDGTDVVHPNKWARLTFVLGIIEDFIKVSLGNVPQAVTPINYNSPITEGTTENVVVATGVDTVLDGLTGNINYLIRDKFAGSAHSNMLREGCIDINGNVTPIEFSAFFNSGWDGVGGNSTNPSDTSDSLTNNDILSSYCSLQSSAGTVIYAMLGGLTPHNSYLIKAVTAKAAGTVTNQNVFLNTGVPVSVDAASGAPENNIRSMFARADYQGRVIFAIEEDNTANRPYLSGVSVEQI